VDTPPGALDAPPKPVYCPPRARGSGGFHLDQGGPEVEGLVPRFARADCAHLSCLTMNVTLSIDEQTLNRARQLAQQRGTSLNQMIQEYLESLTASDPGQALNELERLWNEEEGDSGGWTWNREEVQDRRRLDGLEVVNPFRDFPK